MIPYMVGKLAPNLTRSTRGLVKKVPGRGYFRVVPSQNRAKIVRSPLPTIVEERLDCFLNQSRLRRLINISRDI